MRKWLTALLSALLIITMLPMVGCNEKNDDGEKVPPLTVATDKTSEYVLVYPAGASETEKKLYNYFKSKIRDYALVNLTLKDDSEPAGEGAKEILLGATNRPLSASLAEKLGENQIGIAVEQGQIALNTSFEGGMKLVTEQFISRYVTGETVTVPSDLLLKLQCMVGFDTIEVSNTRDIGGDDPNVVYHDGSYYYCYSSGNGVSVAKIDGLDNIVKDNAVKVYTAPSGTMYSSEYWAPELHYLNGSWYIYVAADDGNNANHRMYVLKGTSQDPTKPFRMVGKLTDPTDKWAIDGTVFEYNGELYTVWSGWEGDNNVAQNLYIAHMSDPVTIDSERVLISRPYKAYETKTTNPTVNEGPAVLVKGNTVTVVYSANGSWTDDYCLATVTCTGGNLLDSSSWAKSSSAAFEKTSKCFGPGHCSFTIAEDGSTWMVYHANLKSGTGWNGRSVWIQPVEWDGDIPVLGKPQLTVNLPVLSMVVEGEVE